MLCFGYALNFVVFIEIIPKLFQNCSCFVKNIVNFIKIIPNAIN